MYRAFREPVSGLTHLVAAFASIAALCILVVNATLYGDAWHITSFAVFGASMFLLFAASALYHLLPVPDRGVQSLQKLDHMMIYVLIAGTYTPFCLVPLRDSGGWRLFAAVWGLAVVGIIMKFFWLNAPRWLTTGVYLFMGWLILFAYEALVLNLTGAALFWLFLGGMSYTVGAIVYATQWPDPWAPHFGYHEVWHLFVIAGAFCHFWAVAFHLI
ncbi:hemolysin [Alkalilimnicola ehrlichii]|uniref:PAQR family membrane homeostasis protein TrhA n=1 Tax=Alkalilimnicola ehrlichii TaxID=351052 RepID=UPI000E2F8EB3|nr:hemolysin III family protein [Alkalilimnicola ehrlichii]RFA27202.1 hemolysin [Alkalilimnicola ehrlichii]